MAASRYEWAALGTYAQLVVDDHGPEALAVAQALVEAVDATCSRFRADSDLTRANAAAGTWVEVDPLLVRAVDAALEAARWTGGLVDPTLGRALVELGYDRDLDLVRAGPSTGPDRSRAVAGRPLPGGRWRDVLTDRAGRLLVPGGCAVDLGATGKAFAADLVADAVVTQLGVSVVVSLGGDVAARCVGRRSAWPVLVSDTAGPGMDAPGETVLLGTGGLATSSTLHRRWIHDGEPVHHILDPRTGRPATGGLCSVTVRAGSCVQANAASTAAVVLGLEAPHWLSERGLTAHLVHDDGRTVGVGSWSPRPAERPAARTAQPC